MMYRLNKSCSAVSEMAALCCVCYFMLLNNTDTHAGSHHFQVNRAVLLSSGFRAGYLSLMHSFLAISQNITINHILSKLIDILSQKYGSIFDHCDGSCLLKLPDFGKT